MKTSLAFYMPTLHHFKRPCSVLLPGRPSEDVPFSINEEAAGAGKTRVGGGGQSLAGSALEGLGRACVLSSSIQKLLLMFTIFNSRRRHTFQIPTDSRKHSQSGNMQGYYALLIPHLLPTDKHVFSSCLVWLSMFLLVFTIIDAKSTVCLLREDFMYSTMMQDFGNHTSEE